MIGYNNKCIQLLPYNAPISLYDKNMHYTKPEARLLIVTWAIFDPPGIFKCKGLF